MEDDLNLERPVQWWRAVIAVVAALGFVVAFIVLWRGAADDSGDAVEAEALVRVEASAPDLTITPAADLAPTTTETTTTTTPPASTTAPAPTTTVASEEDAAAASGGAGAAPPTASSSSAAAGSTDVAPATTTAAFTYPTSADGAPMPVVAVFDLTTVTLSGQVPSQAARDRLTALAKANSQFPDAQVVDRMVVNPDVPISVGVRVIELNSARFPEGEAAILPDHARQLDRVVTIMQALPNISVLVVGHADQRGDEFTNFALSDERARAVVNYLLFLGVDPNRLSSRAAGETDLLSIADDDVSLALNRRTEFIFSGLLIE